MAAWPPPPSAPLVQAEVLRATEQLLAEGASWSDLGVERIATTAGISRTAFYFYFRDKRELLMRLTEDVSELLYLEADRWFSGEGDDEQEIREALNKIAGALRGAQRAAAGHRRGLDLRRGGRRLLALADRALRRGDAERIDAEQAAGKAPAFPAAPTAFALVWMVERTLYQLLVQDTPFPREDAVEALVRIWVRSVYG